MRDIQKGKEKEWSYLSTVMKEFKLTRNQLRLAMERGLVKYREVPNPHFRSGPSATLISREGLLKNLEEIRKLPKYSEFEKERKRIYAKRSRLRGKLGFYCPRCKQHIRVRRDSEMFEAYWEGYATEKELREAIIIAHYRHEHTVYDEMRRYVDRWLDPVERNEWSYLIGYYREFKDEMEDWEREEYIERIREFRDVAAERAKKHYNTIAREMAMEDGLLRGEGR